MGIEVDDEGQVTFASHHEHLLNTSTDKNPSIQVIKGGLIVSSVFRRVRSKGDLSDGNPFIYALKEKNGFSITPGNLRKFGPNYNIILSTFAQETEFDIVVPMPSGHNISLYLSRCVSRKLAGRPPIHAVLRKKTVGEMLAQHQGVAPVMSPSSLKDYRNQLRIWGKMPPGTLVSMKDVRKGIRGHFAPLAWGDAVVNVNDARILLVDDLLASGSTLKSAAAELAARGCRHVSALCLLSGL